MEMDLVKQLSESSTMLLLVPGAQYNELILDNMKNLSGKNVCYVTLNKTAESLKELFKKNGVNVDNIVFIDAISKTFKQVPDQAEGCYFIRSPGALTDLSIRINKLLEHNFEYLIFDSLTNLLVYEKKAPVAKFISNTVNNCNDHKTKAVFYALSVKEQALLVQEASMFVDRVIDLGLSP